MRVAIFAAAGFAVLLGSAIAAPAVHLTPPKLVTPRDLWISSIAYTPSADGKTVAKIVVTVTDVCGAAESSWPYVQVQFFKAKGSTHYATLGANALIKNGQPGTATFDVATYGAPLTAYTLANLNPDKTVTELDYKNDTAAINPNMQSFPSAPSACKPVLTPG